MMQKNIHPKRLILSILMVPFLFIGTACKKNTVNAEYIKYAMSHNDFAQSKPLYDAVSNGFACVEADIFLENGDLFVAHIKAEIKKENTFRTMYLEPIKELVAEGKYTNEKPIYIYVNNKTQGQTIAELYKQLGEYKHMLARCDYDGYHPGPVKVICGKLADIKGEAVQYLFGEGRLKNLDIDVPATSVIMINERWGDVFKWQGKGDMPLEEELYLRKIAKQAKKKGQLLRFWETDFPDSEVRKNIWTKLIDCGVGLISTDFLQELSGLAEEMRNREPEIVKEPNLNITQLGDLATIKVNGKKRLTGGKILNNNLRTSVKSTITDNDVFILQMSFDDEVDTLRFVFDKVNGLKDGIASYLFGDWESWTKPIAYNSVDELPNEKLLFSLWQHSDDLYGAMIPLCGGNWVSQLSGGENGLGSVSMNWKKDGAVKVPFMAIAFGEDPYQVIERLYADGMKAMGRDNNLRSEKVYPAMFEDLGWCTWNAMYEDVSEQKIVHGINTFEELDIRIPWMLIDDGWLCTDDQGRLTSMDFDNKKFPQGISRVISNLKENHGIKHVGVWHTMNGYWSGINATSFSDQTSLLVPYRDKAGVHDAAWSNTLYYAPNPGLATDHNFYDVWYKRLQHEGVSFVKVDQQSVIKRMALGLQGKDIPGYWQVATGMERNLQRAIQKYFKGQVVNCQDMAIEALYNMEGSAIIRNSDDFFPDRTAYFSIEVEKGNAAAHTIMNIHNALWTSQIGWPDYDMFQSHHVSADYHAAARAISGGPVYITDTPGKQNAVLIKKLINSRGELFRVDEPGLPTRDCLFNINKNQPLKAYSRIDNSGVLAIWNTDDANEVSGSWSPSDIEDLKGEEFAAYKHGSSKVRLIKRNEIVPVLLKRLNFEYWNLIPAKNQTAVIGLLNKFNSRCTVLSEIFKDNEVNTIIAEGGEIGVVLPNAPKQIWVDGEVFDGEWKFEDNLLVLEYESGKEILVKVAF